MRTTCIVTLLTVATLYHAVSANGQQLGARVEDQRVVAQLLRSHDRTEAWKGLHAAQQIPPADQTEGLRGALIALLDAKNAVVVKAASDGVALDTREDPDFIIQLSRTVASLRDPRAIPTLAEAIYGGKEAAEALADSGDVAVPAILRVVTSETAHYNSVDFAFTALALMLGEPRDPPISDSSRRAIEAAVMQRLRNFTSFTTLWKAIDVAPLVGSPKLMDALAELATSRTAVTSLGITEDVVVERTQARARSKVGLRR